MKRILSLLIVGILIFTITGCGKNAKRKPITITLPEQDSEAILAAAGIRLPDVETAAGANSVVQYFGWGDPFQNYDEDEIVNTGYFTFQEKYNGKIEYIESTYFTYSDDLSALILASTPPDTMTGGWSFPMGAVKGTIQSVDEWIDLDDPLWAQMKPLADKFAINGHHYQICIKTKPSNVVVYNRRVISDWGFDEPADLYYNDEWTWAKFYDMCMEFSSPDDNRFALDGYAYESLFIESTGRSLLMNDENGRYYSNPFDPCIERGQDYLYNLIKNDCSYSRGGWELRGDFGAGMKEGLCLFYVIGESFFTGPVDEISALWGDMESGEVMFAPLPRDENGDGIYYMPSSFYGLDGSLVLIMNAPNPEGAALLAPCLRFKAIDPVVISIDEQQLRNTYLWNDDMIEMSKECQEIADEHFLIGTANNVSSSLSSVYDTLSRSIVRGGREPSTWAQLRENNREAFEYYIEELNAIIDEFAETLD